MQFFKYLLIIYFYIYIYIYIFNFSYYTTAFFVTSAPWYDLCYFTDLRPFKVIDGIYVYSNRKYFIITKNITIFLTKK